MLPKLLGKERLAAEKKHSLGTLGSRPRRVSVAELFCRLAPTYKEDYKLIGNLYCSKETPRKEEDSSVVYEISFLLC